jgi:uroporphyrinogen decarboxylase
MVLDHKIPDRVPNGLGGCETCGIHVIGYDILQEILGIKRQPPRIDSFQANAVFEPEVIGAMEGDILLLASPKEIKTPLRGEGIQQYWKEQNLWGRTFRVPVKDKFSVREDGSIVWETMNGYICPAGCLYFDEPQGPDFLNDFEFPDPADYNPPDSYTDEFLRDLEETAKKYYEETELSLCLGDTVTGLMYYPGGRLQAMILMVENPDLMKTYLEKSLEASLKQLMLLEQAVGKYVDILSTAQDFGDNRGVMIGEDLWRDIYKPYYYKFFHGWHECTGMKINLHSCGSIEKILGDLIECGLDIYNPVQISAFNMAPQNLKKRFGKDLVFWGGDYDSQMMKTRTAGEVYDHVRQNINVFKEGGGHIFSGVHNLPADMSREHLEAMLKAWKDNRDY